MEFKIHSSYKPTGDQPQAIEKIAESIKKLAEETDMMDRSFELPVKARLWFNVDKYKIAPACATATFTKFQELVDAVAKQV